MIGDFGLRGFNGDRGLPGISIPGQEGFRGYPGIMGDHGPTGKDIHKI